jgi:hypothetical protein
MDDRDTPFNLRAVRRAYPPAHWTQATLQVEDDDLIAMFLRKGIDDLDKLRNVLFSLFPLPINDMLNTEGNSV